MFHSCIGKINRCASIYNFSQKNARLNSVGFVRNYCSARSDLRNCAIIAHVDHGKTTLVDQLLKAGFDGPVPERAMDSNQIEKERGITILSKCTSIKWKDVRINVVDTPGHGDFGGEVERVLSMVDGVVLLVDASEGPKAQTKFVLAKALQSNLKPIVVINKMDRDTQRADIVEGEIFDLFDALGATDEQLDYQTLYASARSGWCSYDHTPSGNVHALLDTIVNVVPPAPIKEGPFSMLITTLESHPFFGRLLTGRVASGEVSLQNPLKVMNVKGESIIASSKPLKLFAHDGLEKIEVTSAKAGDIINIAGFQVGSATDTICDPSVTESIPATPIDPPVVSITISPNNSPLAGKESSKATSKAIKERLTKELESNVSLEANFGNDSIEVKGRGELQISILLENMRREGFEISVSKPKILFKHDENGKLLEPVEEVYVDCDDAHSGMIMQNMNERKGSLLTMDSANGRTKLQFICPSRSLLGFRGFLTMRTSASAVMSHLFHSFVPHKGDLQLAKKGAIIANGEGKSTTYALASLEKRGQMFVGPREEVYQGMVIGEAVKPQDMEVNVCKEKQLTNIRAAGMDENVRLTPHRTFSLEEAIAYIRDDEIVEVTPTKVRLRKQSLNPSDRKRGK